MKKYIGIIIVVAAVIFGVWYFTKSSTNQDLSSTTPQTQTDTNTTETKPITNLNDTQKTMNATLHTNKGDITIQFYDTDAPNTVANFIKLAKENFYDGIKFHRVIKGFMIQAGDPLTKDDSKMSQWGTGGPGYKFADEINPNSDLYKTGYKQGIVAMANSGPNTNGSQFFIMHVDYPLPPLYTIFGKVVVGQDVVDKIANVETASGDRPVEPVVIKSITLQ